MENLCPTLYTVSKCRKDNTLYGSKHGSDDGVESICGIDFQDSKEHYFIVNNVFTGVITCKKCLELIHRFPREDLRTKKNWRFILTLDEKRLEEWLKTAKFIDSKEKYDVMGEYGGMRIFSKDEKFYGIEYLGEKPFIFKGFYEVLELTQVQKIDYIIKK